MVNHFIVLVNSCVLHFLSVHTLFGVLLLSLPASLLLLHLLFGNHIRLVHTIILLCMGVIINISLSMNCVSRYALVLRSLALLCAI